MFGAFQNNSYLLRKLTEIILKQGQRIISNSFLKLQQVLSQCLWYLFTFDVYGILLFLLTNKLLLSYSWLLISSYHNDENIIKNRVEWKHIFCVRMRRFLLTLCNHYYCTVVYILIIYITIFCRGTSLKKKSGTCFFSMMFHDKILLYIELVGFRYDWYFLCLVYSNFCMKKKMNKNYQKYQKKKKNSLHSITIYAQNMLKYASIKKKKKINKKKK